MCQHEPQCPAAADPRGQRAEIVVSHPEQGWYLLCNGIVLFDDGGLMLPDHSVIAPAAA